MKTLSLAAAAVGLIALSACDRGNQEQLGNDVELNAAEQEAQTEDLNALSDQAADVANEAQELENQAAAIAQENAAAEDATGAETPADENIQGM